MSMRSWLLLYFKIFLNPKPTSNPHIQTPIPQIPTLANTASAQRKMCFSWIWSCWDISDKPKCERDYDAAQRQLSWDISLANAIDQKPRETWVQPYLQEETLGIANLQRQYRLLKRYGEETQKPLYQEGVQKREDVQYKPSDEARCE